MNEEPAGMLNSTQPKKEESSVTQPQPQSYRSFCVALPVSGGKPLKLSGDNPHDFLQFLKDSSIAWLNFPVKDIKKEAEIIAISLGFSSSPLT